MMSARSETTSGSHRSSTVASAASKASHSPRFGSVGRRSLVEGGGRRGEEEAEKGEVDVGGGRVDGEEDCELVEAGCGGEGGGERDGGGMGGGEVEEAGGHP